MKNLIKLLAILVVPACSQAQLSYFEAEKAAYYDVSGCTPNSDIQFYSKRTGGKMIAKATVNSEGRLLYRSSVRFKPAFVLNSDKPNQNNARGNRQVAFFDEREFLFDEFTLQRKGSGVTLKWNAEVAHPDDISFAILKSTNGVDYVSYKTIDAKAAPGIHEYAVQDRDEEDGAFYRIEVTSVKEGVRYTSSILGIENSGVKVLPTASNGEFTLRIKKKDVGAKYDIINQQGQLIASGLFERETSVIDASAYASATYFVVVYASGDKHTAKFVRL